MTEQSAEEAVAEMRGAALRAYESYLKGESTPIELLNPMGEHLRLEFALIARIEAAEGMAHDEKYARDKAEAEWAAENVKRRAAEARAEKAETAVLENWQELDGNGHERCRYCDAHVMPGEHEPDCYVAELEARRGR